MKPLVSSFSIFLLSGWEICNCLSIRHGSSRSRYQSSGLGHTDLISFSAFSHRPPTQPRLASNMPWWVWPSLSQFFGPCWNPLVPISGHYMVTDLSTPSTPVGFQESLLCLRFPSLLSSDCVWTKWACCTSPSGFVRRDSWISSRHFLFFPPPDRG